MRSILVFLHLFGLIAWLGGALAAMTVAIASKREQKDSLGPTVRFQSAIYRTLIAPGALVVVVTGILLTLKMYNQATAVGLSSGLMAMQGFGILGALIILVHTLPKSSTLARLEPSGGTAAMFEGLRRKVMMSGMIASMFGMLALVAAAFR